MTPARKRKQQRPPNPPIGAPVPLPKPNIEDPLAEPTRYRRLWAAYLRAGFTRRTIAAALGTNYHTVNRWDAGAAAMSLEMLERASPLVGYSMDELCFGRSDSAPPPPPHKTVAVSAASKPSLASKRPRAEIAAAYAAHARHESPLTEAEIRQLFDTQGIDAVTRGAFGEHAASPAGRYQSFTASYVEAWCAAYAESRDELHALQEAVNTRAVTEAVAAGVPAVTPEALRASLTRRGSS